MITTDPGHPGRLVRSEHLEPLNLTVTAASQWLGVSRLALSNVVNEKSGISPEMALRLEAAGWGTAQGWLSMQIAHDLAQAKRQVARRIKVKRYPAPSTGESLRDAAGFSTPDDHLENEVLTATPKKVTGRLSLPATLDADTERATRAFMQRITGRYPVKEGILYGSRARGTHKEDSDADIAVVLMGEPGNRYQLSGDMAGIAFDVMMETGVMVQALPLWESELKRPDSFSNPALIENIRRDGLRL